MHPEDEDEEAQLRSTALQNVQSILQARQHAENELRTTKEELEEEKRVLELLNRSGAMLASNLDLQAVVESVTDTGTKLSGAELGAFFYMLNDADSDVFTLYALSGASREAFETLGHPRATAVFGPTFRGEAAVRSGDIRTDPRFGQMAPHFGMPAGHPPVCSYLAVPVIARSGKVIGALFFGHREPDVFGERAERLVSGIAAQAAIAIDNARLYEQIKQSADERARLLEAERIARVEVERVSLLKDEFLATLSHEMRTPLNAMLGWSELLLARSHEEGTRRGLDAIARNARAQARLVEDLLDMNLIVSGKIRLDVQRLDLVPVIEAALESVAPSAAAKSVRLRKILDSQAGPVLGDSNRLQQVVWNLLTNAVRFTPKGGNVNVLLKRMSSHVEISVQDSGIGIGSEFLPHMFERFRQADSSTTRKYGGLGLGLSIARQLVELHGGSIRAESRGEGHGAMLTIELPLLATHHARPSSHEHPTSNQNSAARDHRISLAGLTVLVVDDEPDARELITIVLSDVEANVVAADSAAAGIALLRMHKPDVIVSDIGMPERDGYDFIREVRDLAAADGGMTPAIAITAFARSEDRTQAMLAGYQVHLAKPVHAQELAASVKSLASNRRKDGT